MKLIKIGKRYISVDKITDVHEAEDGRLTVFFGQEAENATSFKGDDATALRAWLDANTEATLPLDSEGREFQDYRDRGGNMFRAAWDTKREMLRNLVKRVHAQGEIQNADMDHTKRLYDQIGEIEGKLLL